MQTSNQTEKIWASLKQRRFGLRLLGILALLGLVIGLSTWGYFASSSHPTSPDLSRLAPRQITPPTPVATEDAVAVHARVAQYIEAFLSHDYEAMWSVLHPDIQTSWPNEKAYVAFWGKRFQDYKLLSYTSGQASKLPYWVNPETLKRYDDLAEIPVSLRLEARKVPGFVRVAPEEQHPNTLFQNLAVIVEHIERTSRDGGRWVILNGGPVDQEAPILPPFSPALRMLNVPILMYHHISDVPPKNILDHSLTVAPKLFMAQLDYLKQRGYQSITFNQLFNALYFGASLPTKPIILTFDDGYDDNYTFAYPALKAHGYSGMFYIITGKVGWQGQMNWSQLHELLANGMQIGSHTIHHIDLGQTYMFSPEHARQEIQDSQITLQKNLGVSIQQFCYPAGEPFLHGSPAVQQAIVMLLISSGYIGATTTRPGITQNSQTPMVLLRTRVDGRSSLEFFEKNLPW